ncbi:MAG: hypothetical protein HKN45_04680 [Flavobacteriales bacterium]|nr:hypothetical protein [Flavobacteriales bacterium]
MSQSSKSLLSDIRIYLLLFFLVRLIGITNPPLETGHNWRQTTVTMVARNFLEVDNNILYPRIDIAGEKTGITGMEFPLLNYLIYIISELFGYEHWYGRLINLIISSLGVFYFFKLIKRFFTERTALYASIILLASIWFSFSRKIMPDTFAVSLVIIAFYQGLRYIYDNDSKSRKSRLFLLLLFGILGMLSKLPCGYLFVLFLIPLFDSTVGLQRKLNLVLTGFFIAIPVGIWYFYWVPHLVAEFGFWHYFMGISISEGWSQVQGHWGETMSRFYDDALKFIGFSVFIASLIALVLKKRYLPLIMLGLASLGFAVIILKAGRTFYHHNYYIIPFVPIMAFIAGYGLSLIKKTWIVISILTAIILEGTINQAHDFRIKEKYSGLIQLEDDLDKFTNAEDLILINSGDYPTPMYFAHRSGWVASNERIQDVGYLDSLGNKGLKAIVILKKTFGNEIAIEENQIIDNEDYSIYLLGETIIN